MRLFPPLVFCLALAGCALNRPANERQSFLVQPEHEGPAAAKPIADALRIGRIDVAPPFDARAFVYRRDQVRFETDFYNEFATDPGDMVGEAASHWFWQSGLFREVLPPRAASSAEYRLEGSVAALYVDFRNDPPVVRLAVRWRLMHLGKGKAGFEAVLTVDNEERIPLAERSPHGAALAYGEALKSAFGKLQAAIMAAKL